jgi:hypothetical protein
MFIKDTKYDVLVKISFFLFEFNRIGNVMVGVLAGQNKHYQIGIIFPLGTQRVGLVQSGPHHLIQN